ncbi:maleylpyruvate isomerase N-terminal domain-containing protein [Serinibacter arcticus]|uniref:Mycothiol-dependent maleylpyruvate isomerase metal-binding domain-containing protein n=1 Tax=Serinibacter arcticus TaxID=1655435 RepID=A0A4Z1E1P8_9MICO|nr:maleylpyruvate isomerase N-terminal domain-containing protein [Serinibacter arcticus]TGO05300.1 hypothetical protein SERN_1304 [Serinibacter arcticus]
MTLDLPGVYAAAVARVAELAEGVDERTARRGVPATPAWTVHDLLAHVAGAANDAVVGRMDGAPGRGWTNRQVVERRTASVGELADELREFGARMPVDTFDPAEPSPAWDLLVHEADLREALDLPRADPLTWELLLPGVVAQLGSRPSVSGFEVRTADSTWQVGVPSGVVTVAADDYELLRILFSRRSTEQIARVSDGVGLLESVAMFGPRAA